MPHNTNICTDCSMELEPFTEDKEKKFFCPNCAQEYLETRCVYFPQNSCNSCGSCVGREDKQAW